MNYYYSLTLISGFICFLMSLVMTDNSNNAIQNEIIGHDLDYLRFDNNPLVLFNLRENKGDQKNNSEVKLFKYKELFCPVQKCDSQVNKFNSEFECSNDKMCPILHKCCYHGCYAHKVCVKGATSNPVAGLSGNEITKSFADSVSEKYMSTSTLEPSRGRKYTKKRAHKYSRKSKNGRTSSHKSTYQKHTTVASKTNKRVDDKKKKDKRKMRTSTTAPFSTITPRRGGGLFTIASHTETTPHVTEIIMLHNNYNTKSIYPRSTSFASKNSKHSKNKSRKKSAKRVKGKKVKSTSIRHNKAKAKSPSNLSITVKTTSKPQSSEIKAKYG